MNSCVRVLAAADTAIFTVRTAPAVDRDTDAITRDSSVNFCDDAVWGAVSSVLERPDVLVAPSTRPPGNL